MKNVKELGICKGKHHEDYGILKREYFIRFNMRDITAKYSKKYNRHLPSPPKNSCVIPKKSFITHPKNIYQQSINIMLAQI